MFLCNDCATVILGWMLVSTIAESVANAGARGRSRTGTRLRARDFKSLVSTNFTTRADGRSTSNCGAYSNTYWDFFIYISQIFTDIFIFIRQTVDGTKA